MRACIERAAAGRGPALIEAITYRMEAHTNADDATRYRADGEVQAWLARDPIARLEAFLTAAGLLREQDAERIATEAEQLAGRIRDRMSQDADVDPADLFAHVYARPTAALGRQRAALFAEMEDSAR